MKKKPDKYKILLVVFFLTVLFIWGQSLMPRWISTIQSLAVAHIVYGPGDDEGYIRKYAHFAEYLVLGIELSILVVRPVAYLLKESLDKKLRSAFFILTAFFAGFLIAFIDETLQYISARSPMITDVWIDIFGISCGILLQKGVKLLRSHYFSP